MEWPQIIWEGGSNYLLYGDKDGGGLYWGRSTAGIADPYSVPVLVTAPFIPEHGYVIPLPPGC